MVILEPLLKALEPNARRRATIKENGEYRAASLFFDPQGWEGLVEAIDEVLSELGRGGEWIRWAAREGVIRDSGEPAFNIEKGSLHEFYHYESSSVAFIRLFHVHSDTEDWFALYVDENPETPWWTAEERESGRA